MTSIYLMGRAQYGDLGTYGEPKSLEDSKYSYDIGIPAFCLVSPLNEQGNIAGYPKVAISSRVYATWNDGLFGGNMVYDPGFIGGVWNPGYAVRPAEDFGLLASQVPYVWRRRCRTQQHIYEVIPAVNECFRFTLPSLASLGSLRNLDVGWLMTGKPMNPPAPDYPLSLSHSSIGTGPRFAQASPKYGDGTRSVIAFFPQMVFSPMWKVQYQTSVNATWRDCTNFTGAYQYSQFPGFTAALDVNEKVPTSITINLRFAFILNPTVVGVSRSFLCNSVIS